MTVATRRETPLTEDRFLGGRVVLRQGADGYRAGMDAALLAAACGAKPGQRVIEAGCGAGGALCQIGVRRPCVELFGLERDPATAALASGNLGLNGLSGEIVAGDVAAGFAALDRPAFDWAVCNPPFFDDPGALRAPAEAKRGAWMADDGLQVWLDFLSLAVRDGGRVLMIHRADRLADILHGWSRRCGSFAIRPIQPFADRPAKRVLVRAIRGGRAPLELLPALVLHDRSGAKHAPEADAILKGEAALEV